MAKTACPGGWHLPVNNEWDVLYKFADSSYYTRHKKNSTVSDKSLKAKTGWNKGGNSEDKYGFAALPGGFGYTDGYSNIYS